VQSFIQPGDDLQESIRLANALLAVDRVGLKSQRAAESFFRHIQALCDDMEELAELPGVEVGPRRGA
jgi:hypothetical protein